MAVLQANMEKYYMLHGIMIEKSIVISSYHKNYGIITQTKYMYLFTLPRLQIYYDSNVLNYKRIIMDGEINKNWKF